MNIKEIKEEVRSRIKEGDFSITEIVNLTIDILSDAIWIDGKVSDILMVNGKLREKKFLKGGVECIEAKRKK